MFLSICFYTYLILQAHTHTTVKNCKEKMLETCWLVQNRECTWTLNPKLETLNPGSRVGHREQQDHQKLQDTAKTMNTTRILTVVP